MLSDRLLHIIDVLIKEGPLSVEEVKLYDQHKNDPEFESELKFRKDMQVSLSAVARAEMKEKLQKIDKGVSEKKKMNPLWIVLLALLFVASIFLVKHFYSDKEPDYYAQYFEPYPNVVDPLTKGNDLTTSGYLEYEKKNYEEALRLLKPDTRVHSFFYQGIIHNINGNHLDAKVAFEMGLSHEDRSITERLEWYLSLTHFKLREEEEAYALLHKIGETTDHFYASKAREILNKK